MATNANNFTLVTLNGKQVFVPSHLVSQLLESGLRDRDAINAVAEAAAGTDAQQVVADIQQQIQNDGYIDIPQKLRRWVESQALHMHYSQWASSFHEALAHRGYDYSWKVLVDELQRQTRMTDAEYQERNRFYNKQIAYKMALHFYDELRDRIEDLKAHHTHRHGRRKYIKLRIDGINHCQGLHLDEIDQFLHDVDAKAMAIVMTDADQKANLHHNVKAFADLVKRVHWSPAKQCEAFMNAYKATGGYYVMKDLIMYEECYLKVDDNNNPTVTSGTRHFVEQQESLAALDRVLYATDIENEGYKLLGMMKEFLQYNHFNWDATRTKWAQQSEERRIARGGVARRARR